MELSSKGLYKVTFHELDNIYSFKTKNDIHYEVGFSSAMSYFGGDDAKEYLGSIYNMSLFKKSTQREPFDAEVRNTVDVILQHFFLDIQKSLLYVCDTLDKKEYKRLMKFNKWYFDSRYKDNVAKMDESVTDQDGITYYSTLLFHNQNPYRLQLYQAHLDFIDSLRNK
jgi:hypothetical protein